MKSPRDWIDLHRLPEGMIDKFDDPGHLNLPEIVILVDYFLSCFTGATAQENMFQFKLVPAGNTPIHPSESQEESRELTDRGKGKGRQRYLRFARTVTRCHHPQGMDYPAESHAFATFLATSQGYANADSTPPSEWTGSPAASSSIPDSMFSDTERERYSIMAMLLPDSSRDRANGMLGVLDEHQHNLPAAVS